MFQGGDDGWGGRLTSPDNRHLLVYMSQQFPNIMSEILRHRSHELDREATLPASRMYSAYPSTTHFTLHNSTFYNSINLIDIVTRMELRDGGIRVRIQALQGICLLSVSSRPILASRQMTQITVGISGFKIT
jgi:hypothetical protein